MSTLHSRRTRLAFAALALLGLAASAVQYFWLGRTEGAGPAGPSVDRSRFSRVWVRRPVFLVGIGDSVTRGYGASAGHSYFEMLVRNPTGDDPGMENLCLSAVIPRLRFENRAVSGTTSPEHLARQIEPLPTARPDTLGIVVMTTGGNDIIHDYGRGKPREAAMYGAGWEQAQPWVRNFEARLDRMVESLSARFPGGMHLFLANIFDPTDGVGVALPVGLPSWQDGLRIHRAYNGAIARCAGRHPQVHLVNIRDPLLGHGIYCRQFWRSCYHADDPHYWYYDNFEDPNDRGYDAIRRVFLQRMADVLSPR